MDLNQQIVAAFEGRKWSIPAHIYSRPQQIHGGLKLNQNDLLSRLNALGYRETALLDSQASYIKGTNYVDVSIRQFDLVDISQRAITLRVHFKNKRVFYISNLADNSTISYFYIEPQLIGSIRDGKHEDRDVIRLHDVPESFLLTLLSTEDRKFLHHNGVDILGIMRAMVQNIKARRWVQGGSTITQQLVKNFYLNSERTFKRKFKEMFMAFLLEMNYEKHQILEAYLNEVYLGQAGNRAIHGFELASKFYFGRPMRELAIHESALLVGMIKGPSYYNPIRFPERALERRNLVMEIMKSQGLLTANQVLINKVKPLALNSKSNVKKQNYPGFIGYVRRQLRKQYNQQVLQDDGVSIYTTMDLTIQHTANKALADTLTEIETKRKIKSGRLQGAIIVLDAKSGEILAITSDRNEDFPGFNRAIDAKRLIGSLVKPAVYLTALMNNSRYNLLSNIEDSPITVITDTGEKWTPKNYDGKMHGVVSIVDALTYSYNIPAVKIGLQIGVDNVLNTMGQLGLRTDIHPYPSVLLGSSEHTPLEIAQMFQTIANDGYISPLRGILSVKSADGLAIDRYPLKVSQQVDSSSIHLLKFALREVVNKGTAKSIKKYFANDYDIAGKTGTTNDNRDSWFAGFSSNLVGVVWVGADDNTSTGLTGASGALKVWINLFKQIPLKQWPEVPPPEVNYVFVHAKNGYRTDHDCDASIYVPFIKGTEPLGYHACERPLVERQVIDSLSLDETKQDNDSSITDWFRVLFGGDSDDRNTQ